MHRVCFGSRCVAQGFFCNAFLPVCYGEALSAGPAKKQKIQTMRIKPVIRRPAFEYGVFHRQRSKNEHCIHSIALL